MKSMNRFIILVFLSILTISTTFSQDQTVTLSNGKKAVLHSDYTWSYWLLSSGGGVKN
ncbi:MAG: DUF3157 family protein [Bacteroidales bacterium]|nr:DUF3157 family protein [Bacteroidales bacterium]